MAFFGPYTICPFNKYHRIIDGRLQKHIFKCSKNYPNQRVTCPFDANHKLKPEEYEHHLSICPTSGNVKCYQISLEPEKVVGTVSLEDACNVATNVCYDEDWSENNTTYDPLSASETKSVFRPVVGLSKAKKKKYKNNERERIASIENHNNDSSIDNMSFIKKEPELGTPLRVPKNVSKAMFLGGKDTNDKTSINNVIFKLKETKLEDNSNHMSKEHQSTVNSSLQTNSTEKVQNNITNVDVKTEGKPIKTEINDSLYQNLNKERILRVNPKVSSTFKEAKKISTGRGFTLVYQQIKSEVSQNQEEDKSLEHFNSFFDYDDDKNDDNDIVS